MSTAPDLAPEQLAADTAEAVELLQALVRAPSPNPPGHERAVQDVARAFMKATPGVTRRGSRDQRRSTDARRHATRAPRRVRTIIFGGHVDTVPVGDGWTRDPFGGEVDGGPALRARGERHEGRRRRHARRAAPSRPHAPRRGRVRSSSTSSPTRSRAAMRAPSCCRGGACIVGDAAIITEPSELCVFRAQKGNIFAAARVRGRSAHGSMPERGDNAISRAARLVVDLEERLAPRLAERRHELLGSGDAERRDDRRRPAHERRPGRVRAHDRPARRPRREARRRDGRARGVHRRSRGAQLRARGRRVRHRASRTGSSARRSMPSMACAGYTRRSAGWWARPTRATTPTARGSRRSSSAPARWIRRTCATSGSTSSCSARASRSTAALALSLLGGTRERRRRR